MILPSPPLAAQFPDEFALDSLGILAGTVSKSSLWGDYLRHYQREFWPFRDQQINVIEIGIAGGGSLRMWADFFTKAQIVGIDINPNCRRFADDRVAVEVGSQADPDFLTGVCDRYSPTIVIDDGSHQADHIRFTFEHVFPRVAPGGCYVIEDLHYHFNSPVAEKWRGSATVSPQDYLSSISANLLGAEFAGNVPALAPASITTMLDRVTFLARAVVIWKKDTAEFSVQLTRWESLAEASGKADAWARVALQALQDGTALDRAERAARQAVAIDDKNWSHHQLLSRVRERAGDFGGAHEAARNAISRAAAKPDLTEWLTKNLEQLSRKLPHTRSE